MKPLTPKIRNLFIAISVLAILIIVGFLTGNIGKEIPVVADEDVSETDDFPTPLIALNFADLRRLEIRNAKDEFTLSSEDGDMWIVEELSPFIKLKDTQKLFLLLDLSTLNGRLIQSDAVNLAEFGLDVPSAEFRISNSANSIFTLEVGNENPDGDAFYVKFQGENTVYLAPRKNIEKVFWNLNDIRETALPALKAEEISSMTLRSGGMTFKAVPSLGEQDSYRSITSSMEIVSPWKTRELISTDALNQLFENSAPPDIIAKFPQDHTLEAADVGINAQSDLIEFNTSEEKSYRLEIGDDAGEGYRYARESADPQSIFLVEKSRLGMLDAKPMDLTAKHVFLAHIDRVRRVSVRSEEGEYLLEISREDEQEQDHEHDVPVYSINSSTVPEKDFKKAYQDVIGLLREGVAQDPPDSLIPEVEIIFSHADAEVADKSVKFLPYNRNFYAISISGEPIQFIIGRFQVNRMLENLAAMTS